MFRIKVHAKLYIQSHNLAPCGDEFNKLNLHSYMKILACHCYKKDQTRKYLVLMKLQDASQSCGDLMVDLGDQNISTSWDRGPSLHMRCPRAGLPPLEDHVVGSWGGLAGPSRGQQGCGRSVSCHRSRGVLPSLISQDSLVSQQTVLTHMCEELIWNCVEKSFSWIY